MEYVHKDFKIPIISPTNLFLFNHSCLGPILHINPKLEQLSNYSAKDPEKTARCHFIPQDKRHNSDFIPYFVMYDGP